MKNLFLFILALVASAVLGSYLSKVGTSVPTSLKDNKKIILSFAVVADSHNKDDLLERALNQARGMGINFVVGLGDWTEVGTEKELIDAKNVFDEAKIPYFLIAGDHDLWDSRNRGEDALANYEKVFGKPTSAIEREGVVIILADNSDIYKGISSETWQFLNSKLKTQNSKLTFVAAHKVPFHPDSRHIMGEDSSEVANQAKEFLKTLEGAQIDGFFSGDMHFFAQYKTPDNLKITTVGAVSSEKNFQGPRFAVVRVFGDYTWEVEDVEIR